MAEDLLLLLQLARTSTNAHSTTRRSLPFEEVPRTRTSGLWLHARGRKSLTEQIKELERLRETLEANFTLWDSASSFFLDNFGKKLVAWRCCSRFFLRLPPRSRSQIAATGRLHVGTHQVQLIAIRGHYFLLCEIREFLRVPCPPLGNRLWDGREWEEEGQSRK